MSKILVGYIVEDSKPDYDIPKSISLRYRYRLKLYGFKIFDTALSTEVVIEYSDLKDDHVFGLNDEIFKNSEYAHLYFYFYANGDKDIDIITSNPVGHCSSPLVPVYNKDLVIIDNWSYKYIGYYGDISGSYLENCSLTYNILENEIDLEFCCFSMLYSDFRYLQKNYAYYNVINENIDLAWFVGNDIRDLGLVHKNGYNSIVINPELEYICVSEMDEISIDKLYLCKRTYDNIKVVDTFNGVIESYDSIDALENRLKTIAKELVFY